MNNVKSLPPHQYQSIRIQNKSFVVRMAMLGLIVNFPAIHAVADDAPSTAEVPIDLTARLQYPQRPNSPEIIKRNKPPDMPAQFGEATVRGLIAAIDSPNNATVLQYGYFSHRVEPSFPLNDGLQALRDAAPSAKIGTRKWFIIQDIIGYASFRLPTPALGDGFTAYDTIFKAASNVKNTSNSFYSIRKAISEYVFTVQGRLHAHGLVFGPQADKTLLNAWTAFVSLPEPVGLAKSLEPQWSRAIQAANLQNIFVPYIDKEIHDPQIVKTYVFWKTAAVVYMPIRKTQAIDFLNQARPLLSRENTAEAEWYYITLAGLIGVCPKNS